MNVYALSMLTYGVDNYFLPNSISLELKEKEKLDKLSQKIERFEIHAIIAVGHAGHREKNVDALSLSRALAVKEYLMTLGVAPSLIYVEGKGTSQHIVKPSKLANPSKDLNARVEVEIAGLQSNSPATALGFSGTAPWLVKKLAYGTPKDSFSELSPYIFARSIQDPKLRERFMHKLILTAIEHQKMHELAIFAAEVSSCAHMENDLPNAYQYALVSGRLNALESLQSCKPKEQEVATTQNSIKLIVGVFCQLIFNTSSTATVEQALNYLFPQPLQLTSHDVSAQAFEQCAMRNSVLTQWLVRNGVSVDQKLSSGLTAIQAAMNAVRYDAVQTLLELGANPNIPIEATGETLLHRVNQAKSCFPQIACYLPHISRRKQIWDSLIQHGANPNLVDKLGRLPTPP